MLETTIHRYADAWNRHDVDAILALHTEDSVFENHTSGGLAVGKEEIRRLLEGVFSTFPDLHFSTRRLYLGKDVAVLEWTATATHVMPVTRDARTFPPSGRKLSWNGMDIGKTCTQTRCLSCGNSALPFRDATSNSRPPVAVIRRNAYRARASSAMALFNSHAPASHRG
jgi:steroid delta-isomerase-like uncharacterized protein